LRAIGWTPKSLRAFKRLIRRNPQLRPLIEQTLTQLAEDPFHPSLQTHKLTGELSGIWSCSIDYKLRILFEFVENPEAGEEAILLLNLGSHDEVY
jgi:addiction module RelE/StbE family toxin